MLLKMGAAEIVFILNIFVGSTWGFLMYIGIDVPNSNSLLKAKWL